MPTKETIGLTEAVRLVILATIGLLQVFDVIRWTPEQNGAVLGFYAALSVLLSVVARSKSTPTSSVALTHKDVELLEAAKPAE